LTTDERGFSFARMYGSFPNEKIVSIIIWTLPAPQNVVLFGSDLCCFSLPPMRLHSSKTLGQLQQLFPNIPFPQPLVLYIACHVKALTRARGLPSKKHVLCGLNLPSSPPTSPSCHRPLFSWQTPFCLHSRLFDIIQHPGWFGPLTYHSLQALTNSVLPFEAPQCSTQ